MLLAAGLSQYHISLFHLINHAFFKALLFLTAGAIIHSFGNEQDIRKLGLVYQRAPLLFASLFIGNVAIMGLPFLAGYYSKDLILEVAWIRLHFLFSPLICDLLFILICGATCLTAVYSCRVIYYIVFRVRQYRLSTSFLSYLNQPLFMRGVLVILSLFSLFSGYIFSDFFAQTNLSMLPSVFAIQAVNSVGLEFEFLLPAQKILPVVLNLGVVSIFFCTLYFSLFKNNMVR
jgi:NADH-ubiquinone oxidoreductase chain 5